MNSNSLKLETSLPEIKSFTKVLVQFIECNDTFETTLKSTYLNKQE